MWPGIDRLAYSSGVRTSIHTASESESVLLLVTKHLYTVKLNKPVVCPTH